MLNWTHKGKVECTSEWINGLKLKTAQLSQSIGWFFSETWVQGDGSIFKVSTSHVHSQGVWYYPPCYVLIFSLLSLTGRWAVPPELKGRQLKTKEVRHALRVQAHQRLMPTIELITPLVFQGRSQDIPKWTGEQRRDPGQEGRPGLCSQLCHCVTVNQVERKKKKRRTVLLAVLYNYPWNCQKYRFVGPAPKQMMQTLWIWDLDSGLLAGIQYMIATNIVILRT